MTKTAAGTGAFTVYIYRGVNGTTGDAQDVAQAIGTQTAAIDSMMLNVQLVVTTVGGSGAYSWGMIPDNRATGSGTVNTVGGFGCPAATAPAFFSGTFSTSVNLNTVGTGFGIAVASAVGTPVLTFQTVASYALNVA